MFASLNTWDVELICFCCSAIVAWFLSLQKDHRDNTGFLYLLLLLASLVGKTWKFSVVLQTKDLRKSVFLPLYFRTREPGELLRHQEAHQTSGFLSLCGFSVCFLHHRVLGYEHLLSLNSDTTTFISYKPLEQTVSNCAPSQLLSAHRPLQITASSPRKLFCTSQNFPE